MTYVIIFLMLNPINGMLEWKELPSKTLDTGKEQVFYTHNDCRKAAWRKIRRLEPHNILDYACKRVEK